MIIVCSASTNLSAQWLDWQDETGPRLTLTSVANSDPEEKDMWPADLNNDGKEDLIVVRKQPFSTSTQPGKSNLLLMNTGGCWLIRLHCMHRNLFHRSISHVTFM
ncbi:MAG: hypothetical protein IPP34_09085 [Bacteroidetes bacterium]|nr:hypothetical protein [Bacteroidota bacterium]